MSPINARVAIVEDHPASLNGMIEVITTCGRHSVVAQAISLTEANTLIENMSQGHPKVDVLLVDGNLTPGATGNWQGDRLAQQAIGACPGVTVIGTPGTGTLPSAHSSIYKGDFDAILNAIAEAPRNDTVYP